MESPLLMWTDSWRFRLYYLTETLLTETWHRLVDIKRLSSLITPSVDHPLRCKVSSELLCPLPSKLGIPFWGIKIIETDHSMIYSCVEDSYENSGNDDLRYPIALYVEFTPSIQTLILNYWRSWAADKSHSHAGRQNYLDLWIHFIFSLIIWQHLYLFVTLKSEHINFHLIPCHRQMTIDPSRSAFTPIFNISEVYEDKCLLISSEEGSNDMHPFLLFILDTNINTPHTYISWNSLESNVLQDEHFESQTWSCRLKNFPLDLLRMSSRTRKHLAFVGNQVLNRFLMPTHAMMCTSAVIARWTIEHDVHATLPEW